MFYEPFEASPLPSEVSILVKGFTCHKIAIARKYAESGKPQPQSSGIFLNPRMMEWGDAISKPYVEGARGVHVVRSSECMRVL